MEGLSSEYSSSDPSDNETSDTDMGSDTAPNPLVRARGARRVRSRNSENYDGTV
jgi:hypothetical protein